jgi:hypothetical protein
MTKIFRASVFISFIVIFAVLPRLALADNCDKYRRLLTASKYTEIIEGINLNSNSQCEKNVLALAFIDSNQRERGLNLLADLSKDGYHPATYNLAILINPSVYDARQRMILLKEVLIGSFDKKEFQKLFINSWDSGVKLIKTCSEKQNLDCKNLNEDNSLKEAYFQIGNNYFEILRSKHINDQTDRKNIEEGILGVISLAAFLSIKKPTVPVSTSPAVVTKGTTNSTNAFGTDQKTYLCILGHISSGANRSICP